MAIDKIVRCCYNNDMKLAKLQPDFQRCGISPAIQTHSFNEFKSLPKSNGLYSIWQGDTCIYVGQGGGGSGIRARFEHHHNKAYAILKEGTSHGKGWKATREEQWWDPVSWTIEYFECSKAVDRTYLEGAMMLIFDPLCNDENFEDRTKNV